MTTLLLMLALLAPTDAGSAAPEVEVADARTILAAVKAPGARAVLVNVWATWCEPCREEMPDLVRFHRDHRDRGLRLVLVSADDPDLPEQRAEVARVLRSLGAEGQAFIKQGEDEAFINALEPRWSGALPVTILYDGRGVRKRFWPGLVTYDALKGPVSQVLGKGPTRRKP